MIKILFVCHGNICRSTMAEMIMKYLVKQCGCEDGIYIDSAGTSSEELGNPIYPNTRQVLMKNDIPCGEHFARKMTQTDYTSFNYIICMEDSNIRGVLRIVGEDKKNKIYKLLDFSNNSRDIDDPWYHRDFDRTFKEIYYGCECLLEKIRRL